MKQSLKDAEPLWQERFRSCELCSHVSLPHRDGLAIHRNYRHIFVVLQSRVHMVNYEACAGLQDSRSALSYDFGFEKFREEVK